MSYVATAAAGTYEYALTRLKVPDLKHVLKGLGLKRSGKKAELVDRLRSACLDPRSGAVAQGRVMDEYQKLHSWSTGSSSAGGTATARGLASARGLAQSVAWRGGAVSATSGGPAVPPLEFQASPFMARVTELSPPQRLNASTRMMTLSTLSLHKTLHAKVPVAVAAALQRDPKLRLYLRCGKVEPDGKTLTPHFPRMIRWYLNGQHVVEAAQTRFCPINLSKYAVSGASSCRVDLYQANRIDPVPNKTLIKYAAQFIVAEEVPVSELVQKVRQQTIPPPAALQRVLTVLRQDSADKDDDVMALKTVLSLNCPLSQMRIALPCRGSQCTHLQCFDAMFYLTINSRRETWACPVCSKKARLNDLEVDTWMQGVLLNAKPEVSDVELKQDGSWTAVADDEISASAARDESRKRRRLSAAAKRPAKKPTPPHGSGTPLDPDTPQPFGPGAAALGAALRLNDTSGLSAESQRMFASLINAIDPMARVPMFGDPPGASGGGEAEMAGPAAAATSTADAVSVGDGMSFLELEELLGGGSHNAAPGGQGLREEEPICILDSP